MTQDQKLNEDHCDPFIGIANRLGFQEALRERTESDRLPFGVAVIDIDDYVDIRREGGFIIGESMLIAMARRIMRNIEGNEMLARIDLCRFGILSGEVSDPRTFKAKLEKMQEVICAPMQLAGRHYVRTASIGIAFVTPGSTPGDEVLLQAETMMLDARHRGGDRIEVLEPSVRMLKLARVKKSLRRGAPPVL